MNPELAVPLGQSAQLGVGVEMAARMLVEADRDAEVVGTRLDDRGGHRERAAGRRAPVVHVDELDACEAELRDELVGLDRLLRARQGSGQAAAERELHVGPFDARRRAAPGAPRTPPCPGPTIPSKRPNGCIPIPTMATSISGTTRSAGARRARPSTGANANASTSLPSASVRNGTITSSTGIPICSFGGVALGEARLDHHLAGQLDVAERVAGERLLGLRARRTAPSGGSPGS